MITRPLTANDKPLYFLKKIPKQARAIATVEAILDTAAQILISEGYAPASTNRIAERAGVSIGSLYEYFPSKEAIFAELGRREGDKWYQALVAERPESPQEAIRYLINRRIQYCRDNLPLYTALATQIPASRPADDANDPIYVDFKQMSDAYFADHRQEIQPTVEIEFLSEFLMRAVSATIHDYAIRSPQHLEKPALAEELISMIERYLLKP